MPEHADRPWTVHYAAGVPAEIEIPDEPVTAGLQRSAQRWPDRGATDFMGATATFAQTEDAVRRAMVVLDELGVGPSSRVALVLPNCPSHLVAYHAALRLGAVVIDLNPTYTGAELEHLLADSAASRAVVWHKAVERVLGVRDALQALVSVDVSRDLPTASRLLLRLPVAAARGSAARCSVRSPRTCRTGTRSCGGPAARCRRPRCTVTISRCCSTPEARPGLPRRRC